MRSALLKKLQSRRGETLAEVLISMLIVALAVMLLAVMVSTAGSIDRQTRVRDGHFYTELSAAETYGAYNESTGEVSPGTSSGAYTVQVLTYDETSDTWVHAGDVPVDLYGGSDLLSYKPTT